jgi:hypothetical protein
VSDAPWRPEFDIFERREDDARVMILVDLAAHPLESHPLRMEVFVDHFALFETEEAAKKAAAALEAKGFRIDGLGLAEDEDEDLDASGVDDEPSDEDVIEDEEEEGAPEWHLAFSREDALADGRPDEFVGEVLDVVHEHGGAYDGWGAPHVDKPS